METIENRPTSRGPAVESMRGSLFRTTWLRGAVRGAVIYVLGWGVVTLALRAWAGGAPDAWPVPWGWGALGLVAVVAISARWAHRRTPDAAAVAALLDRRRELGGVMMSAGEPGFAAWSGRVATVQPLTVRWRGTPATLALLGATVFLLGAAWAPMPAPGVDPDSLHVKRQLETLREQVAVLEEQEVVEANAADELREQARRVAEEARADDPVRTWEALDHLARQLGQEGDQARETAAQQSREAAAASTLAQALAAADGSLSAAQLAGAMDALTQLSTAAMNGAVPGLSDLEAGALAAGLDAASLAALQDLMQGREAELAEMMAALEAAGLGTGQPGSGEAIEFDPEALAEFLAQCEGGDCEGEKIAAACKAGTRAGRGGITRGPGHVEMTWKDPASSEGASFEPAVLPPSALKDPAQSRRLGVSRTAPRVEADAGHSVGGGLAGVQTDGGAAATATVLPRHRGAVQRYFERRDAGEPTSGTAE